MTHAQPPTPPRVRLRTLVLGGLGLVVAILVLPVLLAIYDAHAAKSDLEDAKTALAGQDFTEFKDDVSGARSHTDQARGIMSSPIGDFWAVLPGTRGAVHDFRLLTSALDDATSVGELGVKLYPKLAGDHSTLFDGDRIDQSALEEALAGLQTAVGRLESARTTLRQVQGDTAFVGGSLRHQSDDALDDIRPLLNGYQQAKPILARLPQVLGMDGRRHYLIALLNPAELRYSGGAALSLAGVTMDHGQIQLNKSLDLEGRVNPYTKYAWPKVPGNSFHGSSEMPLRNATFAPSWKVSGEELLRGVHAAFGKTYDGLITIDVVAMANLLDVLGPIETPGYGTLTGDNLVTALVGSYDQYPDPDQRHQLNQAVIPAFRERLFHGGQYADKVASLSKSASGGHFAMYVRDPATEAALEHAGLAGELSDTPHDYLGVFTQNTNGSKVDIHQHREITYAVSVGADGGADARLSIRIDNTAPPYAQTEPDQGVGYFTRLAGMDIAAFLPEGATLRSADLLGRPFPTRVSEFQGRPWISHHTTLWPNGYTTLNLEYYIPHAARVDGKELYYNLTFQPQATVIPASMDLAVTLPAGYRPVPGSVPHGWSSRDGILRFRSNGENALTTWRISSRPTP